MVTSILILYFSNFSTMSMYCFYNFEKEKDDRLEKKFAANKTKD